MSHEIQSTGKIWLSLSIANFS